MELTPVQRMVAFAAAVLVLAGLGIYLFLPQPSQAGGPSGQPPPSRGSTRPGTPPASRPPPAPGPGAGATDIYQWVPFTQAGLASAASLTTRFAVDYGSYSYRQSTAAYLAPMRPLAQAELVQVIGRAFASPGLVATRTAGHQVAVATASIVSLRAFGPTSLTFIVQVDQKVTGTKGSTRKSTRYAVTVTGAGTSWQVSDIEYAGVGNS